MVLSMLGALGGYLLRSQTRPSRIERLVRRTDLSRLEIREVDGRRVTLAAALYDRLPPHVTEALGLEREGFSRLFDDPELLDLIARKAGDFTSGLMEDNERGRITREELRRFMELSIRASERSQGRTLDQTQRELLLSSVDNEPPIFAELPSELRRDSRLELLRRLIAPPLLIALALTSLVSLILIVLIHRGRLAYWPLYPALACIGGALLILAVLLISLALVRFGLTSLGGYAPLAQRVLDDLRTRGLVLSLIVLAVGLGLMGLRALGRQLERRRYYG